MMATGSQQARVFRWNRAPAANMDYLLFLPKGYSEAGGQPWPLILFLHGAGERGHNLDKVRRHGLPSHLADWADFPAIVASPQCPPHTSWSNVLLLAFLDHLAGEVTVDLDRLYVTGMSMGGYATWSLAVADPSRFAAIAPVCGGGDPFQACRMKGVPVWAFHGADDDVVPLRASQEMVEALRDCGGDVRLTVYPHVGHDAWTPTYANPDLYGWLFSHARPSPT
jgi:predicted peptidase